MENYLEIIENACKAVVSVSSLLLGLMGIYPKLNRINPLFKKRTREEVPTYTDIRTNEVLKDLEVIRIMEQKGLPYMERIVRDQIFCLYELLNGKLTYEQVGAISRFVDVNDNKKYCINITRMDNLFSMYLANAFFIAYIIFMAFIIFSVPSINNKEDGLNIICQISILTYILLWIANINTPIVNAKKAKKIIDNKDFIYTEKK